MRPSFVFGLSLAVVLLAAQARADLVMGFVNITANNPGSAAIGEAQLFVDVTSPGTEQTLFTFYNTGPEPSSITDVYFDDGSLLAIATIDNSDPGVQFSQFASPPNLSGGNTLSTPFQVTAGFLADSDPPAQPNGVNPGESLGILFSLQSGRATSDVESDLMSGDLRIGIHVQGFEGGWSEGFVNTPPPIPAPGAALLGVLGLGLVSVVRKRLL